MVIKLTRKTQYIFNHLNANASGIGFEVSFTTIEKKALKIKTPK